MADDIIILTSYTIKGVEIQGNFPIYVNGVSQCCIDEDGNQIVTPVEIIQQ